MITRQDVLDALQDVSDPELPISIVDLGLVEEVDVTDDEVRIRLVTTFMACPGRRQIAAGAQERVRDLLVRHDQEDTRLEVEFDTSLSWSPERLSPRGRAALSGVGCGWSRTCPHCGSGDVVLESAFGSSVCSARAYCAACRTPFEIMKGEAQLLPLPTVRH